MKCNGCGHWALRLTERRNHGDTSLLCDECAFVRDACPFVIGNKDALEVCICRNR